MTVKISNSALEQQVNELITLKIRPQLQLHGGDIKLKKIEDGNVWVVFEGACKTCPSAKFTTEEIVEKLLKEALGECIKGVYLIIETDEELLDFAKKMLIKKQ